MPKVPKSEWLNIVLERAEQIKSSKHINAVTVECFLLSLLICMREADTVNKAGAAEEVEKTKTVLSSVVGYDFEKLSDALEAAVSNGKPLATVEIIALKSLLLRGESIAYRDGKKTLTADVAVKTILECPPNSLQNVLSASKQEKSGDMEIGDVSIDELAKAFEKRTASGGKAKSAADPKSRIAELTVAAKELQDKLLDKVYGQDNAVSVFARGYFQSQLLNMTDKKRKRPGATYLFAGPPGVGKTFLAETAAEILGLPFARFDMSEYSDKEANIEFCGSDKVYKNGKAGNVTSFVEEHPKCILLFDEIEKAHINVIHLFLQMLDAGRLRDNYTDVEVSFTDTIIIFTTNAGKKLYTEADTGNFSAVSRKVILKALENDVNPDTGIPYFPGAMCSRFASGNVVMFNRIDARNLTEIAKREILRHADNFSKEIGVKTTFDERVFSSVIFAEGGAADARTVRGRAESFFDSELFELLRFIESSKTQANAGALNSIDFSVDLSDADAELVKLFESDEKPCILVFASAENAKKCADAVSGYTVFHASTIEDAKKIIEENEIKIILCDVCFEQKEGGRGYLNIEDINSKGRDFFRYATEYFAGIPTYILCSRDDFFTPEENISFMRNGARGFITAPSEANTGFFDCIRTVCETIHQQQSMLALAQANKVVKFETAQTVSADGTSAQITLFDFRMELAVDSEDTSNVLDGVSKPKVRFDQVIGAEDAKSELMYFVDYLKNPKKYAGMGVSAPKGVLLYGPPGTGKTMLAKAVAGESNVTFIAAEGNQFLKTYIGEGKDAVHNLFATARKYAPSVLFIDEIDAIAKERKSNMNNSSVGDTLTAFLTEMDGFNTNSDKPVFVLAATNFDVEPGSPTSLDAALLRRFDRRVLIDLPGRDDRIKYLKMKVASLKAIEISDEEIENIAIRSTGMSLASLESVIEFSLRTAIRKGTDKVTDEIFEEAFETFNNGEVKRWDSSQLERVARHEAGHAFLCWHSGETPSYLTVVARGDHGGYMQHADNEGKAIYTKDELLARIRVSLGGRASEIVYYGETDGVSTGASGDFMNATSTARRIICNYGMDESFGLAVIDERSLTSGEMAVAVRARVNEILDAQMKEAVRIISENKAAIDALVDVLMAKNHLRGEEIDMILRNAQQ